MEENLSDLDDLREEKPRRGRGSPKLLRLILILLLVVVLVGGGAYVLVINPSILPFSLPFGQQAAVEPTPSAEGTAAAENTEPAATEVGGASIEKSDPTATTAGEAEVTATEAPTEEDQPAPGGSLVGAPGSAQLLFNRASASGEWEEKSLKLAGDMAIKEPYDWEYYEFEAGTPVKDVLNHYIQVLNKDMGFRMTFNETYPNNGFSVFKFKYEAQRVTIQFWAEKDGAPPAAIVFYENW